MISSIRKLLSNIQTHRPLIRFMNHDDVEPKSCVEIKIPVPWGNIYGKWWGPQKKRPILVLHGIQENCGTFDRLIPLLTDKIGFLTVDLVGHGRSSHLPEGMFYSDEIMLSAIHYIKTFFEWDKISLMGHSSGAVLAYLYTLISPTSIDVAIFLDALYPQFPPKYNKMVQMFKDIERCFLIHKDLTMEPLSASMTSLKHTMHIQSGKSIDLEHIDLILSRGVKSSKANPGTYHFSRDMRCNLFAVKSFDREDCLFATRNLVFPILITKTQDSPFFRNEEEFLRFQGVLTSSSRYYEMQEVLGSHHVHLNEPEKIAKVINKFLLKIDIDSHHFGKIKGEIRSNSLNVKWS